MLFIFDEHGNISMPMETSKKHGNSVEKHGKVNFHAHGNISVLQMQRKAWKFHGKSMEENFHAHGNISMLQMQRKAWKKHGKSMDKRISILMEIFLWLQMQRKAWNSMEKKGKVRIFMLMELFPCTKLK